ncbi:MAG: Uma2 family endonuclease [Longimicrobiales bacterium]
MEAKSMRQRWTYADYVRLPVPSEAGGTRYEIIDHELYVTPSPGRRHQGIVTHLVSLLHTFVRAHGLGQVFVSPFDVLFAEGDYLEPDILFVRKSRADIVTERGIEGPPDLVIEVLSPSTASRDRGIKLERYRLYGVPEYWVIDPDHRMVEVWRLAERAESPLSLGLDATLEWMPEPGTILVIDLTELFEAP